MTFLFPASDGKTVSAPAEVEETANSPYGAASPQLMEQCGVTEQLKSDDMMKVGRADEQLQGQAKN